jgi:hypothetical protein
MFCVKAPVDRKRGPTIQPITLAFFEGDAVKRWNKSRGREEDAHLGPNETLIPVTVWIHEDSK